MSGRWHCSSSDKTSFCAVWVLTISMYTCKTDIGAAELISALETCSSNLLSPSSSAPSKAASMQKFFSKLQGELFFHWVCSYLPADWFKVFLCVATELLYSIFAGGKPCEFFCSSFVHLAVENRYDSVLVNALVSVHQFLRCCSSVESVNFLWDCKFHFQVLGITAFPWCSEW